VKRGRSFTKRSRSLGKRKRSISLKGRRGSVEAASSFYVCRKNLLGCRENQHFCRENPTLWRDVNSAVQTNLVFTAFTKKPTHGKKSPVWFYHKVEHTIMGDRNAMSIK
jgi:hypothetical protein